MSAQVPHSASTLPGSRRFRRPVFDQAGLAQLSVVEHALCPLDPAASLTDNLQHVAHYRFTDSTGHQKSATATVLCPDGLSPNDEFYLWGLLALTFSQPEPSLNFHATPYFCLRRFGCFDRRADRGGKNYELFRQAISRLSAVTYRNDRFFDPLRGEHRQVGFGFLSYSLPLETGSARAWRFAWDPIFFEFASAVKGHLTFDLRTYRELPFAARRLFLLLQKIFWRNASSPAFDVRELCVEVLGFAPTVAMAQLKQKLLRAMDPLLRGGILTLPLEAPIPAASFEKKASGSYRIRFHRGPYFDRHPLSSPSSMLLDSPLTDPLRAIGFDDAAVSRLLKTYKPGLLQEWADITLAALERNGRSFFKNSPQAYFVDNVREAAAGINVYEGGSFRWHARRNQSRQDRADGTLGAVPMSNPARSRLLMPRDVELLAALDRCPLTVKQLLKLSASFEHSFASPQRVRGRLQALGAAGWVHRFRYATASRGAPEDYCRPSLQGYRLLYGEDAQPPTKRYTKEIGLAHQHHAHSLAEFVVHTVVCAHRHGVRMMHYYRENTLALSVGDETLYPDAAFELRLPGGQGYHFLVEIDAGTERVRSPADAVSWERKIRLYDRYQDAAAGRFRVLIVSTRSRERLLHILDAAADIIRNPQRRLFYGVDLPAFLVQDDAVHAPCVLDHHRRAVALVPSK